MMTKYLAFISFFIKSQELQFTNYYATLEVLFGWDAEFLLGYLLLYTTGRKTGKIND